MSIDDQAQARFEFSDRSCIGEVELAVEVEGESEITSLVELILMASESSEDEGEVRDRVDAIFDGEWHSPENDHEYRIPSF